MKRMAALCLCAVLLSQTLTGFAADTDTTEKKNSTESSFAAAEDDSSALNLENNGPEGPEQGVSDGSGTAVTEDGNGEDGLLPEDGETIPDDGAGQEDGEVPEDPETLPEDGMETVEIPPGTVMLKEDSLNVSAGKFTMVMTMPEHPEDVSKVLFAVWSAAGGQDDLKWYTVTNVEDDMYSYTVNIKNHKYDEGTYNIHAYTEDKTGRKTKQSQASVSVKGTSGTLDAKETKSGVYKITFSGLVVPGGVKSVSFAVWSEKKDQDDLKWYTASKQADGSYQAQFKIADHKHLGKYIIHAYAVDKAGRNRHKKSKTVTVPEPSGGTLSIESVNVNKGTCKLRFKPGANPGTITNVQFAVWSATKNQDDLVWYMAKKEDSGDYIWNLNIKKHAYDTGKYNIHVYTTDTKKDKKFQCSGTVSFNISTGGVTADASTDGEKTFRLHALKVQAPGGIKSVRFAVWSVAKDQDDLKWYVDTAADSSGNYDATAVLTNHKHTGDYNVHAYVEMMNGKLKFIGSTTFTITKSTGAITSVVSDDQAGTITISGTASTPSGVGKVQYAVWQAADQSDICWYTAEKQSDGTYRVIVNVKYHNYHYGTYSIHMYVTGNHGIRNKTAGATTEIYLENYIYYEELNAYRTQYRVGIVNPVLNGQEAERVQIPTWSNTNDQDDLKWYEATKKDGKNWSAVISGYQHKHVGLFHSHIYVTAGGTRVKKGAVQYTMTASFSGGGLKKGIDVSHWQGRIDWNKVKASGVKFAIIRCGRGWDGNGLDDNYWAYNVAECERLKIPYGVYIYSYAQTTAQAEAEARHALRLLKGHYPALPVFYDLEDARTDGANYAANMKKFAGLIEGGGYRVGAYANLNWWNGKLNSSTFDAYDKWVAQWNVSSCAYKKPHGYWQYSSKGSVPGIDGYVDLDYAY